jgi:hypothetical protein
MTNNCSSTFYKLQENNLAEIIDKGLTKIQMSLYLLIQTRDPFKTGLYFDSREVREFLSKQLNRTKSIARETISRAISALKKLGLIEEHRLIYVRPGHLKRKQGRKKKAGDKNYHQAASEQLGDENNSRLSAVAPSDEGERQAILTDLEAQWENSKDRLQQERVDSMQESGNNPSTEDKIQTNESDIQTVVPKPTGELTSNTSIGNGKIVRQATNKPVPAAPQVVDPYFPPSPRKHRKKYIPDGPWKTENGAIDLNMVEHVARLWCKRWEGTLEEKILDVMDALDNKPERYDLFWDLYAHYWQDVAKNYFRTLKRPDGTFNEDYRDPALDQKLVHHSNALQERKEKPSLLAYPEPKLQLRGEKDSGTLNGLSSLQQLALEGVISAEESVLNPKEKSSPLMRSLTNTQQEIEIFPEDRPQFSNAIPDNIDEYGTVTRYTKYSASSDPYQAEEYDPSPEKAQQLQEFRLKMEKKKQAERKQDENAEKEAKAMRQLRFLNLKLIDSERRAEAVQYLESNKTCFVLRRDENGEIAEVLDYAF